MVIVIACLKPRFWHATTTPVVRAVTDCLSMSALHDACCLCVAQPILWQLPLSCGSFTQPHAIQWLYWLEHVQARSHDGVQREICKVSLLLMVTRDTCCLPSSTCGFMKTWLPFIIICSLVILIIILSSVIPRYVWTTHTYCTCYTPDKFLKNIDLQTHNNYGYRPLLVYPAAAGGGGGGGCCCCWGGCCCCCWL